MIDETKLENVLQNLSIGEKDEAFAGKMPEGACEFVNVAEEPKTLHNERTGKDNNWYPVAFRASDGQTYELSLKGLLQADGLQYTQRSLKERIRAWYALNDVKGTSAKAKEARAFNYTGKKGKSVTYKKDWVDFNGVQHHAGESGTIEGHTFGNKLVG